MVEPVGQLLSVVLDCADAERDADFWSAVLGYRRLRTDTDWIALGEPGGPRRLSFQQVTGHPGSSWPADDRPQQLHLDVVVADLEVAQARVLALGASPLAEVVEDGDETFRVYADPAGHPFCLIQQHPRG